MWVCVGVCGCEKNEGSVLRLRAAQQQIDVLETTLKHRDHYIVRLEQLVKYVVDRERCTLEIVHSRLLRGKSIRSWCDGSSD